MARVVRIGVTMETRISPALIMRLGDEPFDSVRCTFDGMRRLYASFEHIRLEEIKVFIINNASGQIALKIEITDSAIFFYDVDNKLVLSFSKIVWDTNTTAAQEMVYNFIYRTEFPCINGNPS